LYFFVNPQTKKSSLNFLLGEDSVIYLRTISQSRTPDNILRFWIIIIRECCRVLSHCFSFVVTISMSDNLKWA